MSEQIHDTAAEALQELKGLVATVVTTGSVKPQFSAALSNMRDWNTRNGFLNVEYKMFDAKLVESGRDAACSHALDNKYDWILQIDADAAAWAPQALAKMLETAYVNTPNCSVVGAYCQLKGKPYLPTIDTGTGTWEYHHPGAGVIPVIRTGGHFLLVKTDILAHMGQPWFRTRIPYSPAKAMKELDNFARTKLDGKNPLVYHSEWLTLLAEARRVSVAEESARSGIGEDSGFCDNVRAMGGQIVVDTDLVIGHVADFVILPKHLRKEFRDSDLMAYAAVGVRFYE